MSSNIDKEASKAATDEQKSKEKNTQDATSNKTVDLPQTSDAEEKHSTENSSQPLNSVSETCVQKDQPDTLIITAEDELETGVPDENVTDTKTKNRPKKLDSKCIWISNITRDIKAADLKKLFSKHAKVSSAKVVTNGKAYFGYIGLLSPAMVDVCIREVNGTKLGGTKLVLTRQRPITTLRRDEVKRKINFVTKKNEKLKVKKIDEPEVNEKEIASKIEILSDKENVQEISKSKIQKYEEKIQRLRKERDDAITEVRYFKNRIIDSEKRLNREIKNNRELRKELERKDEDIRIERRRLLQEKDQLEKKMKVDQSRFDSDKSLLNKELDECKKLREFLQNKIDEMNRKRRLHSRSISPVNKRSPVSRSTYPKRYRYEDHAGRQPLTSSSSRVPWPTAYPPTQSWRPGQIPAQSFNQFSQYGPGGVRPPGREAQYGQQYPMKYNDQFRRY